MEKIITDKQKIKEILTRRVDEILIRKHLKEQLLKGRRLKIKLGIDPTSPDLHLGHSIVLKKLREFQALGHEAILLVGDFTAKIGDPSGRARERKKLTDTDIKGNMQTYKKQAGKILDLDKLTIRYNSEWLEPLGVSGFLELAAKATYNQIIKRRDFKKRLARGEDLSFLETLYPLLQGYDSVALKADVELGGTDQKLNLLMGRQIQERSGQTAQDIVITKLLIGLEGKIKMSKSEGNYIGLLEKAEDMYAKVMSIPDRLTEDYLKMCTDISLKEITESKNLTPMKLKKSLARELVSMYHSKTAATAAETKFERVVQEKGIPEEISNVKIQMSKLKIVDLLVKAKMTKSKSEARRLVKQGGVAVNDKRITDPNTVIEIKDGMIIRAGKRGFARVEN